MQRIIRGARPSRALEKASRFLKLLSRKVRFGETPKPTPETGVLPRLHAGRVRSPDILCDRPQSVGLFGPEGRVRSDMDWIKTHYDRVVVIAAAAFLFLASVAIWRSAADFGQSFMAAQGAPPPKKPMPPGRAVDLDTAAQEIQEPPQWTFSGRSGLFVPEKHFIGANGLPATLQNTQVHPPVPNEWLEQFSLPIADADVLESGSGRGWIQQSRRVAGPHQSDRQEFASGLHHEAQAEDRSGRSLSGSIFSSVADPDGDTLSRSTRST